MLLRSRLFRNGPSIGWVITRHVADLDANINDSVTTFDIVILDPNRIPRPGKLFRINGEKIRFDTITPNTPPTYTIDGVERGAAGTTAAPHLAGDDFEEYNEEDETRITDFCVATSRLRNTDSPHTPALSPDGSLPADPFYEHGQKVRLYTIGGEYQQGAPVDAELIIPMMTPQPGRWRHYAVFRTESGVYAIPYIASYPIVGFTTTGDLAGFNFVERYGYSGESVRFENHTRTDVDFEITTFDGTSDTVSNLGTVLQGDTLTRDPTSTVDFDTTKLIRAINAVDVDSPGFIMFTYYADPTYQNAELMDPLPFVDVMLGT